MPLTIGLGEPSAPNGNRVARVNIAWYSAGFSVAKLLYRVGDPGQHLLGFSGTASRLAEGFCELAETLQCDGLDDVFHGCEVLVEHWLAVLDLGGQPTGRNRIPALALGKGAGRCGDESAAGSAITKQAVCDGHAQR